MFFLLKLNMSVELFVMHQVINYILFIYYYFVLRGFIIIA